MATMLRWWQRDREALAASQPPSRGMPFAFQGTPEQLLASPQLTRLRGKPAFGADGSLICDAASYAICEIEPPWNTNAGRVVLDFAPKEAIHWDGGGNPNPGWAIFHLCDERFTASAVTVMHFYDQLHVRFYDRHRKLIEVLEANVQGWPAGERRRIEFAWNAEEASLWLDGREVHRVPMQRLISGAFRRLYLGCKPGNWKGKGTLYAVDIRLHEETP